jgi:oligopeptidase A
MDTSLQGNPLLSLTPPFDFTRINAGSVVPAITALTASAREAVNQIANQQAELSYESTLGTLEAATYPLEKAAMVCEHLEGAANSPELREAWGIAQPMVSAFWSELPLHEGLFQVLSRFSTSSAAKELTPVRLRHLEKTLDEFRRHGAELSPEGKKNLTEIDVELSRLTTKFSQNVLDATNAFELTIEDEARLAGLPPLAKQAARASAEAKGLAGYRFTLHAPSLIPALTYLEDRELRETLYRAHNERAASGEFDNRALIRQILGLRKQRAVLLGFETFADLVTQDRMAKSSSRARAFVERLREQTRASFAEDKAALSQFAGFPLMPWDVAFQSERLRRERFDFDEEQLRPYLPLETVLSGAFATFERLYGVTFEPAELPTWDSSVRPFLLKDGSELLAHVYVDLFPRENKTQGAWMAPLQTGVEGQPHVAVVAANFTPPVGNTAALLTHREVETLFHELGHLMHQCLSKVPVRRLAGTNVAWDFVELPSQIMENWTWERAAIDLFARHHQTGAAIPDELFDKMMRARTYRAASVQMQQLGYAELDLQLHTSFDPESSEDPVERARSILAEHVTAPLPLSFAMVASFGHLFGSAVGYAGGYYSYKWAEVLDADAFDRFKSEGLFSREVGKAFRDCLLSQGDASDPEVLFRSFRGRDPEMKPLLTRLGLA